MVSNKKVNIRTVNHNTIYQTFIPETGKIHGLTRKVQKKKNRKNLEMVEPYFSKTVINIL